MDVLKIDAEGSEYKILYSSSADTLARTQMIIVECDTLAKQALWSIQGLAECLQKAGFVTRTRGLHLFARRPGLPVAAVAC